ncbi:hypothetical protein FOA52_005484 [Chlamydomonas sp. UWO 241]|nr:hypothetical protein FOA52_005484 [Chlamydomonas sp. UWO 241]
MEAPNQEVLDRRRALLAAAAEGLLDKLDKDAKAATPVSAATRAACSRPNPYSHKTGHWS